ncbi:MULTISPECIES: amino acid ABC transporter permease [Falsihalocynthiibacter]|uniref:amino acid ABC transporter permease n=1 Tax=Falsihalocynthiibacter TaxID=2854182 RepID=UPI0030013C17
MAIITPIKTPDRAAPLAERSIIGWMHKNLFSSWFNAILTVVTAYLVYITVTGLWTWGVTDATFIADSRRECFENSLTGACWAGVIDWFDNIFYGRYPREQIWRINLGAVLLVLWMAPLWMSRVKGKVLIGAGVVVFYPFLAGYLFAGGEKGLLTQLMVSGAIVALIANTSNMLIGITTRASLKEFLLQVLGKAKAPDRTRRNVLLAIVLFVFVALGRRSKLTVVRVLCTGFIEVFRSVPLITVLFMATTMFPLFMPEGFVLNKLVQVIIAVVLFNACYMAETVRAGLQAIPSGQYEAAHTIGLGYWRTTGLVIMPQALKYMIPNIVGTFISLLKDTTLVSIIGLFDILGMLRSISKDIPWLGLHKEPLIFGAMLFFVLCFSMSKYSRHLETKLSAGDQH